ncbi:MAG TPA: FAD-dependent oxidoreductase, partial [Caulobacteraceae bacterium]|nr:FAD-dependent oxidoreductase [Caulobacteraceae bacterium]
HAQAFAHAVALYPHVEGAVIDRGVLQLETAPRDAARFAKIAASDLFEPEALAMLGANEVSAALGEAAPSALRLAAALVVEPHRILAAWLPPVEVTAVAGVETTGAAWRLLDPSGRVLAEAEIVCLANGASLAGLWAEARILPVRGQLSWTDGVSGPAAAWGAYVAPTRTGIVFGATHDRDDAATDRRASDDARNLAALAARLPGLAARLDAGTIGARATVRATTPDRMPLAGQVAPGLFVLGGLGSRGFTLAPLLAEHVAALALGAPSPLARRLAHTVSPVRFAARPARRGLVGAGSTV